MNDVNTSLPLVAAERLSLAYDGTLAVHEVSFEVRRGDVLGFLGPNGAGKSTTMQIITGNLAPSAGRVLIDGVDMLDDPKHAKSRIGYLPEHPPLYRELTVDEYLLFCARLNQVPKERLRNALDHAKLRCGLTACGARLIGNLSKGYQQRVGIAQAIIHGPPVVILDEPTVGLDPIQIRDIRGLIRELGHDHSVILSTHILPEVQAICNRVQIINNGSLVMSDTIDGLRQRMQSSTLTLAMRQPPGVATLLEIPGVLNAESLPEGRFRLHYAPTQNPAEAVVERSVAARWGLYELIPERVSLEDIFVNLTTTENEVVVSAARGEA